MKGALQETALRITACLLFLGSVGVALTALFSNEPGTFVVAIVLFAGAMFFGAWSRRV